MIFEQPHRHGADEMLKRLIEALSRRRLRASASALRSAYSAAAAISRREQRSSEAASGRREIMSEAVDMFVERYYAGAEGEERWRFVQHSSPCRQRPPAALPPRLQMMSSMFQVAMLCMRALRHYMAHVCY